MFTVLSAPHWGPPEDTSSQPSFLLVTDLAQGPFLPFLLSLETLGLGEEWGTLLCVCNHHLTAGSVDWGFCFNLIFNT